MNTTDFTVKKSTVISTIPTNAGTEIWARREDGREASYLVNDDSFRARAGHEITAVLYGRHPVALRNDTTMTKIQLLAGEDLVGSSPVVPSRPAIFWIAWFIFISFLGPYLIGIGQMLIQGIFEGNAFVKCLSDFAAISLYAGAVFGVPYWCIVHPRILRSKHNRRIKEADAAIAKIFAPL
jgi:hypothetical protein